MVQMQPSFPPPCWPGWRLNSHHFGLVPSLCSSGSYLASTLSLRKINPTVHNLGHKNDGDGKRHNSMASPLSEWKKIFLPSPSFCSSFFPSSSPLIQPFPSPPRLLFPPTLLPSFLSTFLPLLSYHGSGILYVFNYIWLKQTFGLCILKQAHRPRILSHSVVAKGRRFWNIRLFFQIQYMFTHSV